MQGNTVEGYKFWEGIQIYYITVPFWLSMNLGGQRKLESCASSNFLFIITEGII